MPRPQQHSPQRPRWLTVFGSLLFSLLWHGSVCFLIARRPQQSVDATGLATWRPILVAFGITALISSVMWLRFKMDGKIGGGGRDSIMSARQFQSDCILALGLSEACTIFGGMLCSFGLPLGEFAFFAIGTLLVNFAFILPRGLQFWAASDKRGDL